MGKTLFVSIITLLTILVSCEDQDDTLDFDLQGKWTLSNVMCFCAFEPGTDFSTVSITVTGYDLTVEDSADQGYLSAAEGPFTIDGDVLTLNDGRRYTYSIADDGNLALVYLDDPDIADDEVTYTFVRAN